MPRLIRLLLLITILLSPSHPTPAVAAPKRQAETQNEQAAQIVADLTPEERVGQLFLVTFTGADTGAESPIYELITQYHLGGVVLLAANDNFSGTQTFITGTIALTSALQSVAAGDTSGQDALQTRPPSTKSFIPLFIAASYEDENYPGNSLMPGLSGLTALPSAMTIGATWNTTHAQTSGQIAGKEFSTLGINLLFGPTLDVVEAPQPDSPADLGARTFGGDPYWVGKLGQSFIQGVHTGSDNRVAVVARHFPGYGASDRAVEDQIPTINKSLAELIAVDLDPFFAATKGEPDSNTDALLVSHIRYRGFQNIRETTRPISFDPQALTTLLSLPDLAAWRAGGGVMISDALGLRGVRRFYDPQGRTFQPFKVALDAFLAGNDVLYLSQFAPNPQDDQTETVKSVISQFVQKYEEDPAFALRVDEAVTRIVGLKLKMYGDFSIGAVLPPTNPEPLADNSALAFAAARDAATLISPSPAELADRLPSPPTINQQIVFFTDTRISRQCSVCAPRSVLPADGLEQAILRLYGPQGSGQVIDSNLLSFTFADLVNFLDGTSVPPTPTPDPAVPEATPAPPLPSVEDSINNAEWLVFAMLDVKSSLFASDALKRILDERPDLIRGKRLIVFAFDAPYYLDSTEVAQLTAYYGLYSKTPAALQVAARILFQELAPAGASPISIPAVGYALTDATQPDPVQIIELFADLPEPENATPTPSDVTPTPPAFALRSVVALRTGVIKDHNGNPVPDGTVVSFLVNYLAEGFTALPIEATTVDGVARTELLLDRSGLLEVSAASEPALVSYKLRFDVGAQILTTPEVIIPSPFPTNTPTPSATPTVTATPTITPTPTPEPPQPPSVGGGDLLMALIALAVLGGAGWRLTNSRGDAVSAGVKLFLAIAIGVFAGYNYYALGLPGAMALKALGALASPLATWSGGLAALIVGWLWLRR